MDVYKAQRLLTYMEYIGQVTGLSLNYSNYDYNSVLLATVKNLIKNRSHNASFLLVKL